MKVMFAKQCAWRAMYVFVGDRQVAHLGIDPEPSKPQVFGRLFGWSFRFTVPHLSWSRAAGHPVLLPLYRAQGRLLHRIDGRF